MNPEEQILSREALEEGMVLLVDKPLNWTSFDVVAKLRGVMKRVLKVRKYKVGHAGTLDPLATGLLILCTGRLTKKIEQFQNLEKEYTGCITLGATTPSFDLEMDFDNHFPIDHITPEALESARHQLTGEIIQEVPVYSAIKVDGERSYKKVRAGESVRIKSRSITIHSFDIDSAHFPAIDFVISASKGTYIRAIANDFGRLVESGGHLSELRRTAIGTHRVEDAWNLDNLVDAISKLSEDSE